jgi:excisionase family DNA binding protein
MSPRRPPAPAAHDVAEPARRLRRRDDDRPLLSVTEAAALAGLSRSVAYALARAGQLPGLVAIEGHRYLVRRRVLEAWLGLPAGPGGSPSLAGGLDGEGETAPTSRLVGFVDETTG